MKNIPDFPNSKKLTIDDKEEIQNFVATFEPYSDYNFTTLYCYNLNDKIEVSWLNQNLVVLFQDYTTDEFFYSFIGTNKVNETILTLLNPSSSINIKSNLRLIPECAIQQLTEPHSFSVTETPNSNDYILLVDWLCDYEGEQFRQKRYSAHLFKTNNPGYSTQFLDIKLPGTKEKIYELCKLLESKNLNNLSHSKEFYALQRLLENSSSFNTSCFVIFLENKLVSFIIYELINDTFAIGHFEKSDLSYKGITPFLIQELAKELKKKGIIYLNYEDDLGIEGLRIMKQRFRPINYLKKYTIETIR